MTQKSGQQNGRVRFTFRQLEVFLATAHDGSTRAAAERTPASALVSRIGSRAEEDGFITVDVLNSFCNAGCLVQKQNK